MDIILLRLTNTPYQLAIRMLRPIARSGIRHLTTRRSAVTCPGQGIIQAGFLGPYAQYRDNLLSPVLEEIDQALDMKFTENLFNQDPGFARDWLMHTANAQPAIVSTTYIINYLYEQVAGQSLIDCSDAILGHSLGEYSALLLSGVTDLSTAVRLVRRRGELMQSLLDPTSDYGMMALMIRPNQFDSLVSYFHEHRVLANINSFQQLVILGEKSQLQSVLSEVPGKKSILKKISLPVQIPFHNELLSQIEPELTGLVDFSSIKQPRIPIISNLSGEKVLDAKQAVSNTIAVNSKPVQWVKSLSLLQAENYRVLNLGPGEVLHNLNSKFDLENVSLSSLASFNDI